MSDRSVIITGAGGFIGKALVDHFVRQQYSVYALVRQKPVSSLQNVEYVQYDLANDFHNEEIFAKTGYLIHCAYTQYSSHQKNADEINLKGTENLLRLTRKYNLKKFVFLSSFSAHDEALSHYGRVKLKLEGIFDVRKDLVLKPGLVLGNGGLYGAVEKIIKSSKFIPLLGGGRQPLQTIHVNDLAATIQKGMEGDISGIYPLAEPTAVTIKDLYRALSKAHQRKNIFIPMPYWMAGTFISLAGIFGMRSPVSEESLLGLKKSRSYDISRTLKDFQIIIPDYLKNIDRIIEHK